ncbi:outer membrane beta-barrel protein [Gluconacetobacter sacchari]|uniref:Outer membrane beta-barrel protein n=1 Tax=Gluconacetobacter sacchari TaxID=92759 RepID=A0A7W4NR13_9PROT|nr:outer membrane beta-barrel protein [Gluconacetobacter sacchari]MBB2160558.1 outer membrane beta-barrel protein [Gluconacetobacter sacchari]
MTVRSPVANGPGKPARGLGGLYRLLGVVACAAPFLPATASAQVLSQYFPELGRGVGETWVDTEQIRISKEYQAQGLHLGGFKLNGAINEGAGYIDNANHLPGGMPSAVISTAAQLGLASDWSTDSLYANASVSDMRYPSQPTQNQTTWTATIGGYHDIANDRLGFDYSHLNLVQTPNVLGSFATIQPIKYQVDRAALSYTLARDGRFSLMPEANITNFSFDQGALLPEANGIAVPQTYRDRAVIVENLTARYRWTRATSALVMLRGTEIRYTHGLAGYPGRDSNGLAVLAGIDYSAVHLIDLRVMAGYQRRFYRNATYPDYATPIIEAQASWAPTRLTRLELNVQHGIEDSAFENVAGFSYTTLQLGVTHQYQRDIILSGHFTFQKGDYQNTPTHLVGSILTQAGGSQTIIGGGLSAQWLINRHFSLNLNYDISNQNVVGTVGKFTVNTVMVRVNMNL